MVYEVKKGRKHVLLMLIAALGLVCLFAGICFAASSVRIVIDGEELISDPNPFIENGRTLVPIRFISEKLGAKVEWNNEERVVTIEKGNRKVILRIDSHLVIYDEEKGLYGLSDVAPKIVEGRTFVPVRLVSNALGVGIEWDPITRTVYVDSGKSSEITPFYDVKLAMENGSRITGRTLLGINLPEGYDKNDKHVKYVLLDPGTAKGFVIAMGNELDKEYTYLPDIRDNGRKVLAALIYDKEGKLISGDVVGVNVEVEPKVELTGIKEGDVLDTVTFGVDTSFIATKVEYEILSLDRDSAIAIGKDVPQDPYGTYTWNPKVSESGRYSIKAVAYDTLGNAHESMPVNISVEVEPKLGLSGVSNGQTISRPVTLLASRNFDVKNTRYILVNPNTGEERLIDERPYGGYKWFPGPDLKGKWGVLVEVTDSRGNTLRSDVVEVNIGGEPILLLYGIGPNEVVRESKNIRVESNVDVESVKYILKNRDTGEIRVILNNSGNGFEETFTPGSNDGGSWSIKAIARYKGKEIESEEIPFRVYLGITYGSVSIVNKDNYVEEFLNIASQLAVDSWKSTGMSAALQAAQSILETGWGRYVPVDKYTGKVSYNLFGIKGKGPVGSVTINTREVYNGISYYVDAEFRAYNNIRESWADHKDFLLNSARYEPFKEVMHNSILGAWALKRSGYATDPEYALSLIRIIEKYNLRNLDIIGI